MRTISARALLALILSLAPALSSAQPSLVPVNNNAFGGVVTDVERVGDTLFVAGSFLGVSPANDVTGGLAIVNKSTGARAVTTNRIRGPVYASVPDGAGGYYIAGGFSDIAPPPTRNGIAHIRADGSVDTGFLPPAPNANIFAMARVGNTLYLGGAFTAFGAVSRTYLAAVNATTGALLTWNPAVDSHVTRLVLDGTTVYVAGTFTTVRNGPGQPLLTRQRLASVDAATNTFTGWNPGANFTVDDIVVANGTAYIAGSFSTLAGQPRSRAGAVDATSGTLLPWNPAPNDSVRALTVVGSSVILGGLFTSVGGQPRRGLAAIDGASGGVLPWAPQVNDGVYALASFEGQVVAGGDFTRVDAATRAGAAAFDFNAGGALQSWNPSMNGTVWHVNVDASRVTLGGTFNATNATVRKSLVAIDAASGNVLPWNANVAGFADRLASDGTTIFASGFQLQGGFTGALTSPERGFQAFDVATATRPGGWTPSVASAVDSIAVSGTEVLLAVADQSRVELRNAATGGAASVFATYTTGGFVREILAVDGRVYLAGQFSSVNGVSRSNLAVLDRATRALLPLNIPVNGSVTALAVVGQTLYIGGNFSIVGGQSRTSLAAIDLASNTVTSWNPIVNSSVSDIAVDGGLVYVSGNFLAAGGQARSFLAVFTTAGALTSYEPLLRSPTETLWIDDEYFVVGGSFDYVNASPPLGLAIFRKTTGGPTNLQATVDGNRVRLRWTAAVPGANHVIEAGLSSGTTFATLPVGGVTDILVEAPNGRFYVRVRAQGPGGLGPPSNEVVIDVGACAPPAAPTGLGNSVAGQLVSLSWQPVAGATGYILEAGNTSGASNIAVAPLGPATSLQVAAPPGVYYVRVRAASACGTSQPSNETIVTVAAPQPPGAPTNLTATITGSTVSLQWTPPSTGGSVATYVIEVGSAPGASNILVTPIGPNPGLTATGAPPGTYYVRIRGRNSGGDGPPSAQLEVTVP